MKPFERNWLKEATEIAAGKKMPVRKEHVVALYGAFRELGKRTEKMDTLLKKVMHEVIRNKPPGSVPNLKSRVVPIPEVKDAE